MQDTSEVGWSAQGTPAHTWATEFLQWSAPPLCVAYLVRTSVGGLAPVASRVIRWASARHKPALSAVVMARLDWVWSSPVAVGGRAGAHLLARPVSTSCNMLQSLA